jgi:hypothetical protein
MSLVDRMNTALLTVTKDDDLRFLASHGFLQMDASDQQRLLTIAEHRRTFEKEQYDRNRSGDYYSSTSTYGNPLDIAENKRRMDRRRKAMNVLLHNPGIRSFNAMGAPNIHHSSGYKADYQFACRFMGESTYRFDRNGYETSDKTIQMVENVKDIGPDHPLYGHPRIRKQKALGDHLTFGVNPVRSPIHMNILNDGVELLVWKTRAVSSIPVEGMSIKSVGEVNGFHFAYFEPGEGGMDGIFIPDSVITESETFTDNFLKSDEYRKTRAFLKWFEDDNARVKDAYDKINAEAEHRDRAEEIVMLKRLLKKHGARIVNGEITAETLKDLY